jgi:subtilisin family serine protease
LCLVLRSSVVSSVCVHLWFLAVGLLALLGTQAWAESWSPLHFSNGYELDAGGVQPAPPAELEFRAGPGPSEGYYVIRFTGPIVHPWLEQLARLGAQPVGYLPQQAIVARVSAMRVQEFKSSRVQEPEVRSTCLESLPFVAWACRFQPVFKVQREVLDLSGTAGLLVVPFPDHDVDSLAQVIAQAGIAVQRIAGRVIEVRSDYAGAARMANLEAVEWIQRGSEPCLFNDNVQWVVQTGWQPAAPSDTAGRRVWYKGIRGQGLILSLSDTGINTDHEMFLDPMIPIRDAGIYLHHRKIVAYKMYGNQSVFGDAGIYHGTGTDGTAAGNDTASGGLVPFDGVASEARIYFLDLGGSGGQLYPDDDLTALFDSIYLGRGMGVHILQTSQSWGWGNTGAQYDIRDATADAANWRYPDLLTICAAGNLLYVPRYRVIAHPAAAKNVLTAGGCGNGVGSCTLYTFECRGPTADGRIKPDIVAPAIEVMTAGGPGPSVYQRLTGTSLATPAANGACALIRQYLRDGWYPDGTPDPSRPIANPSSALMRALAIVSADPNVNQYVVPDSSMGWGRLDLDSVLYFAGDSRRLVLYDVQPGLASGEVWECQFDVDSLIPLRACLCWTDTAAMPNAETTLVNNLDMEVRSPASQYYHGNLYYLGESAVNPSGWDNANTAECFRRNQPVLGRWRIQVTARNVFTERQPFALAITGSVQSAPGITEAVTAPAGLTASVAPNPARGTVSLTLSVARAGPLTVRVFDRNGRLVRTVYQGTGEPGNYRWQWDLTDAKGERIPPGVYFLRLRTEGAQQTEKLVVTE